MDLAALSLDGLAWPPEPKSLDGLTWLPEPTSLQLEPTSLDGLTRPPEPRARARSLDRLTATTAEKV